MGGLRLLLVAAAARAYEVRRLEDATLAPTPAPRPASPAPTTHEPSAAPTPIPTPSCMDYADHIYGGQVCATWLSQSGWSCLDATFAPGGALEGLCDRTCDFCPGEPTAAPTGCPEDAPAVRIAAFREQGHKGWGSNVLTLSDDAGAVAAEYALPAGETAAAVGACVPAGVYDLRVGGGAWAAGLRWEACGLSGAAPYAARVAVDGAGACVVAAGGSDLRLFALPTRGDADACGDQAKLVASVGGLGTTTRHAVTLTTTPAGDGVAVANGSTSFSAYVAAEARACNGAYPNAYVTKLDAAWTAQWEPPVLEIMVTAAASSPTTAAAAAAAAPAAATNGTFGGGGDPALALTFVDGAPAVNEPYVYRLVDLAYSDSFGDGWNGAALTLRRRGADDDLALYAGTLSRGHGAVDEVLLPSGCYDLGVSAGSFAGEISWSACDAVVGGAAPASTYFCVDGAGACVGPSAPPTPTPPSLETADGVTVSWAILDGAGACDASASLELAVGSCAVSWTPKMDVSNPHTYNARHARLVGASVDDDRIARHGEISVALRWAVDEDTWSPYDAGQCEALMTQTTTLTVAYDAPGLTVEVVNEVARNDRANGTFHEQFAAGYALTGREGKFVDRAGEKSSLTAVFACEAPHRASDVAVEILAGAAVARRGDDEVGGASGVLADAADCLGVSELALDVLDGFAAATFSLCGTTVSTDGSWTCDGAPAGVARDDPGEPVEGAVAIGPAGGGGGRCARTFDAPVEARGTLELGALDARVAADGAVVAWGAPSASLPTDCAAPVRLDVATATGGALPASADLCGGAASLAWTCGANGTNATTWTSKTAAAPGDACAAVALPQNPLPCGDALDDAYGAGTCAGLAERMACARQFCPGCPHARSCDATCGFCAGATSPPTSAPACLDVSVGMYDTFGDGWNDAYYLLRERWSEDVERDTFHASGTLKKGSKKVDRRCLPYGGCYDFSVTAGAFPSEVRWELCDAAGGAPEDSRFCVSEEFGCERELAPGIVASIVWTPVNGSCSGVAAPSVVLRAPALSAGKITTVAPYFEDRTSADARGSIFKAAATMDSFVIKWDDAPPGAETDCDMDIVATSSWAAAVVGEDVVAVTVENQIGALDSDDNDGAGVSLDGYAPVVGLKGRPATTTTFHYRVARVDTSADWTLRDLASGDVLHTTTTDDLVLADGCYVLSVLEDAAWSLCDGVAAPSADPSTGVEFCVVAGACSPGTRPPTMAATEAAEESAYSGLEKHVKFVARERGEPSCSDARLVEVDVSVDFAAPGCALTLTPAFDASQATTWDGRPLGAGQLYRAAYDLAAQTLEVQWEDHGDHADCEMDLTEELRWSANYAYPTLTVTVDAAVTALDGAAGLAAGYEVAPGGYGPQLFPFQEPVAWTREQFLVDCAVAGSLGGASASVRAANGFELFVNGAFVRAAAGWASTFEVDALPVKCDGSDVLAVAADAGAGVFGLAATFDLPCASVATSDRWACDGGGGGSYDWTRRGFDDAAWARAAVLEDDRAAHLDAFPRPEGAAWLWTAGRGFSQESRVRCRFVVAALDPASPRPTPAPSRASTPKPSPEPSPAPAAPAPTPGPAGAPGPTSRAPVPAPSGPPSPAPTARPAAPGAAADDGDDDATKEATAGATKIVLALLGGVAALGLVACCAKKLGPRLLPALARARTSMSGSENRARRFETELNEMMLPGSFSPLRGDEPPPARDPDSGRNKFSERLKALHRGDPDEPSYFAPPANEDSGLAV